MLGAVALVPLEGVLVPVLEPLEVEGVFKGGVELGVLALGVFVLGVVVEPEAGGDALLGALVEGVVTGVLAGVWQLAGVATPGSCNWQLWCCCHPKYAAMAMTMIGMMARGFMVSPSVLVWGYEGG